jgi:hypothetical protein
MKTQNESTEMPGGTKRAGVISLLIFALCYLWVTGLSNMPRMWLFIVSFAVCLVMMIKSAVDLLIFAFEIAAGISGRACGRAVRIVRRFFSHA